MKKFFILLLLSCSHPSILRQPQSLETSSQVKNLEYFKSNYLNLSNLTINEKIIKFHEVEQYTVRGMPHQKEYRQYFTKAFDILSQESRDYLSTGLINEEVFSENSRGQIINEFLPYQLLPRSVEGKINIKKYTKQVLDLLKDSKFVQKFKNKNKNLCHTYKHLYLYSFWKLLKLAPSFEYDSFYSLIELEDATGLERFNFIKDIKRAIWSLRFLKLLNSKKIISKCEINSISLVKEFDKRYDFIFNFIPKKRKPLGFAVGMCGRPMNSHYLDTYVESKTRKQPKNWDFESYKKIKEFISPSDQ